MGASRARHWIVRGDRPMTLSRFRRIGAPLATAAATALVFTVALWAQHARSAWPFEPSRERVVDLGKATMPSGEDSRPAYDRVSVDVSADTAQALGIRLEV